MVLFGIAQAWTDDDERTLIDRARRVVRATSDGPLLPELRDGVSYISCYSSATLLAAILEAEPVELLRHPAFAADELEKDEIKHSGSVLLVDDNPVNRELIQQQLETLGYAVDAAEDGVAALRLWQEGRYEVVLTDINMPNMNGYELTQQLRGRGAKLPILAVTATALASEKVRCKQAGINELLLKPLSLERLDEAMSRHLASGPKAATPSVKWAGLPNIRKKCVVFSSNPAPAISMPFSMPRTSTIRTPCCRAFIL